MVVDRVKYPYRHSEVRQVRKDREASLEELARRVEQDPKAAEDAMVCRAKTAGLDLRDYGACRVQVDALGWMEDLERMVCLVDQGPTAHLVIKAEMEVEVPTDGLA